jgi:hypothetical protein
MTMTTKKLPEIDLSKNGLDYDRDDYTIMADLAYPNNIKLLDGILNMWPK